MSGTESPEARIAALEAELAEVRRRDAEYRLKMVSEFLDRGERNSYLHVLREERAALIKREQEASADLEILTRKLEDAEAQIATLESKLRYPPKLASQRPSAEPPPPGAPFTYYLHTSPFRVYRDSSFTLRGWAWPQDGRALTAIRVSINGALFGGKTGIEEPEVIARYGDQPQNPKPGFEVTFELTPGRHAFGLEAQIAGTEWRSVMRTSVWCDPTA